MMDRDDISICGWLMAIWSMLTLMALNQCSTQREIEHDLRSIEHEIRMLRYN